MSVPKAHRILLIGDNARKEEGRAAAAITPGHLIAYNSSGTLIPHATSGGKSQRMFAEEDSLIGNTIATPYASGDLVQIAVCGAGTVVQAFLASGQSVTPADFLTSNGDGSLRKSNAQTDDRLGQPLESLDLTASGSDKGRIRVRLL